MVSLFKNGEKMQIYPDFFKVYLAHKSSQRMIIPPAFLASIDNMMPEKIILRSCLGRLWQVEVVRTETDVSFVNGWEDFVRESSLEEGDFLVFRYNGDCVFNFKIYGRSGCEKEDIVAFYIKDEDGQKESGKDLEIFMENMDLDEDDDVNDYKEEAAEEEDDDDDDDYNEEEEEEEEEEDEEDDDDDDDDKEGGKAKAYGTGRPKKGGLDIGKCKTTAVVNIEGENEPAPAVEAEKDSAIEVGRFQSQNPYFVAEHRSKRGDNLQVPTQMLRDFDIQLPPEMIFCDPFGEWRGEVTVWKDGRTWIGGWGAFCRRNNVGKHDKCICELMQGRGYNGNLIQVHIVSRRRNIARSRPLNKIV